MNKKIKLLTASFDITIKANEISAFRGALAAKVGLEHDWFHNHNNSKEVKSKFYYRYPLIQYKRYKKKPMLVCIADGIEEANKFFSKSNWDLVINGKEHKMKIDALRVNSYTLQVTEQFFQYNLKNWLALNQKNYRKYKKLETEEEQKIYLEQMLINHILGFAIGVHWQVDEKIKVKIHELQKVRSISSKGSKQMAFSLSFSTNVFLPNYIGIGKSTSKGFGVITKKRDI